MELNEDGRRYTHIYKEKGREIENDSTVRKTKYVENEYYS